MLNYPVRLLQFSVSKCYVFGIKLDCSLIFNSFLVRPLNEFGYMHTRGHTQRAWYVHVCASATQPKNGSAGHADLSTEGMCSHVCRKRSTARGRRGRTLPANPPTRGSMPPPSPPTPAASQPNSTECNICFIEGGTKTKPGSACTEKLHQTHPKRTRAKD